LFRSLREADFPKPLRYLGFGKSYLIPETTNFEIGEGIVINTFANLIFVSFIARSGFPETFALLGFREIVPHSRNNKF